MAAGVLWSLSLEPGPTLSLKRRFGPPRHGYEETRAHTTRTQHHAGDHEDTLATAGHLAYAMSESGQAEESERLRRETLAKMRRVLGGGEIKLQCGFNVHRYDPFRQ